MAYIGNQPISTAFVTDLFSGNGSTVAFTMTVAPANTASILVAVSGVVQSPDTYSISGTTLTFSAAPPTGTGNISVRYLGIPATNVTTTAYRTVTEFTATAGQTTFSVPSYTVGYIDVYRNGVRLGTADYTATSGTTVVLANAATVGDLVATESFYVSSVLNAIPAAAGQVGAVYLANGAASQAFLDVANLNGTGALLTPSGNTAQRPASPAVGMQRWNTTIGGMEVYIGTGSTGWQTIASTAYSIDYLVVAGGGSGGGAGGGGAGGVIYSAAVSVSPGTAYVVTIGAGAAQVTSSIRGNNGNDTSFGALATAIGGGGGGNYNTNTSGANGGSGGGGGWASSGTAAGGSGTGGQGFSGGNNTSNSTAPYLSGGGGGGGAVGGNNSGSTSGAGGVGYVSSINGTSLYWGGGGGGGCQGSATGGAGGLGGGGGGGNYNNGTGGAGGGSALNSGSAGTSNSAIGGAGGANTGGGGGGMGISVFTGGAGGSGVVIIRYAGSVQRATGGTVTITGGYVIHTFTSSGTYTA
jgi:hypothetical protein